MTLLSSSADPTKKSGPLLLSALINFGFQGVMSVQLYTYYTAFPKDRFILKCLVYAVFALEMAQTFFVTRDAFYVFSLHFGDLSALDAINLKWLAGPVLGGFVAVAGQLFFAYRVRVLSKSWVPTVLIISTAICTFIAAMMAGASMFATKTLSMLSTSKHYFIVATIWNVGSVICDVLIAGYMAYHLSRYENTFRLHKYVARLIRLTIETGTATAIVTTLTLVFFIYSKKTTYFSIPCVMLAKLYSNTMLLILNNRMTIVGGRYQMDINASSQASIGPPCWRIHAPSERGNPTPNMRNSGLIFKEIWSDETSSSRFEVTCTNEQMSLSSQVEDPAMTQHEIMFKRGKSLRSITNQSTNQ
ncbi:hypothetical protein BDZ94DRAFT_142429 [Collybia nuda]|uniref:DUF6534 domain-containing protein n=1 Tax=Collybia nuda TaxID=64659 RepID=A0A9P6CNC7_9AGAR|nr:hypothetical protein BDZ94DRAFT_142429 [Collybia nuda]